MEQPARGALVTGGARRLGAAMAKALARDGFDVALHCSTSLDAARTTKADIEALGRRAAIVTADLAKEEQAARVVADARAAIGPLGVLVNNASVFRLDRLATADRTSWDRHLEVNLRAPIVLSQAFARQLPEGTGGLIVNLLDSRVLNPTPNFLSYTVSKAGLWAATQVLARELAPRIRVNAIGPGPTLPTPGMSRARFEELCRGTLLRRGPSPEEIANALRFIVASPSMTGQMITLDGGQQLGWLTPEVGTTR